MGRRAAWPGAGGGAVYVGRGPVCGMMTRRTGAAGAAGTSGTGAAASTGAGGGVGGATGAAGAAGAAAEAGGRATTTPAGGGVLLAIAGRSPAGAPGRTTTPAGGRAPKAGRAAGCTITGAWRACGTMRRGASPVGAAVSVRGLAMFRVGMTGRVMGARAGTAGAAGGAGGAATTGAAATGAAGGAGAATGAAGGATGAAGAAATTTGTAGGAATTGFGGTTATTAGLGAAATTAGFGGTTATGGAISAWRRSASRRAISPGFEAFDRSIFGGAADAACRGAGRPPVRCPRTFSASSSSMELEWVFFSLTPTAVSASRISLLLTSSSRAKSLIRTLLIRPRYSVTLC